MEIISCIYRIRTFKNIKNITFKNIKNIYANYKVNKN